MNVNQGQRKARGRGPKPPPSQEPQLFDDTSAGTQQHGYSSYPQSPEFANYSEAGYTGPPQQGSNFPGQQYLHDPMANMAVNYGHTLANQGQEYVQENIKKYVSASKLKYYFAVDTSYVGKKLGLLLFPYAHKEWSVRYNQDEPVAPRYEINAPDLYIPVMALVTYILLAGVVLGTQNRFSPEQLGMTTTSALVWLIIEIVVLLISMYILQVTTDLKYLDLLAYCGYKYVGMILALAGRLMFESQGYYLVLLWTSLSLSFFLIRSLKMAIVPHSDQETYTQTQGTKRQLYMLIVIAVSQPIFMWFLTRQFV